jgi:hypothetical protein
MTLSTVVDDSVEKKKIALFGIEGIPVLLIILKQKRRDRYIQRN